MKKDYLKDKAVKKKTASKAGWMIVVFVVIFAILIGKFALTNAGDVFSGLPDSDTAYGVAKQYIMPTVLSHNITFSDDEYKFAKKSDSVYVIKSSYITKESNGESEKTNFTITLKYNGGAGEKSSNWALVNLDQNN
ncbi:hypothetical protein [Mucilaginibacter phyllosphaerae]|uniref:DUF4878 domain-containing protein n=1 Tax=Mucilaginibacter phyllosphaerae TaxID=1812349 RepID=A0A4Y8ADL8_9SPHI|nr:hypothetical protein [Mucilaginibacter phyllosphaerae]MBB3969081.1 hypothetical protein [Mucilaginibacter phyllosphaerae]TEW66102.1 hypothetical protein E2R65_13365 [Mucilaginibacter phyllosphaerae]GGH06112.1 hypothetical protein GCM10007352_10260 [Mucilaginibacter phyllosphaerae]